MSMIEGLLAPTIEKQSLAANKCGGKPVDHGSEHALVLHDSGDAMQMMFVSGAGKTVE